jgi:VWFA-related protein
MTRHVLLAAPVILATAAVAAQDYRSGVDLVTVPIVVTGRGGEAVDQPLAAENFRVLENGVEQTVTFLTRERLPTSVCVVLDSSMSMKGWKQRIATATVDHLFTILRPDDEASVVTFSTAVRLALPWLPAPRLPRVNWERWRVGGTTPLIDAMQRAITLVNDAANPRTVVLVVSDGLDNDSHLTLGQIATTRRQSETQVYAVRTEELPEPPDGSGRRGSVPAFKDDVLGALVGDSGGVVYSAAVPQRAEASARAFVDDIESQWVIGYVPKRPPDGTYRRLKVEAIDRPWTVRHRGGYLAQPLVPRSK